MGIFTKSFNNLSEEKLLKRRLLINNKERRLDMQNLIKKFMEAGIKNSTKLEREGYIYAAKVNAHDINVTNEIIKSL